MSLSILGYYNNDYLNDNEKLKLSYISLLEDSHNYKKILDIELIKVQVFHLENLIKKIAIKNNFLKSKGRDYFQTFFSNLDINNKNEDYSSHLMNSFRGKIDYNSFNNPDVAKLFIYWVFYFDLNNITLKKLMYKNKHHKSNYILMKSFYNIDNFDGNHYLSIDLCNDRSLNILEDDFRFHLLQFKACYAEYINLMFLLSFILKNEGKQDFFTGAHKDIILEAEKILRDKNYINFNFYKENEDIYNLKHIYDVSKNLSTMKKFTEGLLDAFNYKKKIWFLNFKFKDSEINLNDISLKTYF